MSRWPHKIPESMPPLDEVVWLAEPEMGVILGGRGDCVGGDWCWFWCQDSPRRLRNGKIDRGDEEMDDLNPTHWAPFAIPELPGEWSQSDAKP